MDFTGTATEAKVFLHRWQSRVGRRGQESAFLLPPSLSVRPLHANHSPGETLSHPQQIARAPPPSPILVEPKPLPASSAIFAQFVLPLLPWHCTCLLLRGVVFLLGRLWCTSDSIGREKFLPLLLGACSSCRWPVRRRCTKKASARSSREPWQIIRNSLAG